MADQKTTDFLKTFLIYFSIFYLALFAYKNLTGKEEPTITQENITISPIDSTLTLGNVAQFKIKNETKETVKFESPCEGNNGLKVYRLLNDKKFEVSDFKNCKSKFIRNLEIPTNSTGTINLKEFSSSIFSEEGRYILEAHLTVGNAEQKITSQSIEFSTPGTFRKLFRFLISRPLFNLMALIIDKFPNHSLGFSIIILTLFVRFLLFFPNQKSMKSQRKLQKLQPKIEELKKKYGKNQQALALKTMELYKSEKINPMSSCLPMLAQMPVMLGIYYVVKDGVSEHLRVLLYDFNSKIDLSQVNTEFFGLNLEVPNIIVLPLLVGGAQFLAIKLSFIANKKKQSHKPVKKAKSQPEGMAGQMEQMQKMMQYFLPVMLAFFTATFPAAVGIYWLTSTIFGIFQQKLVNYQLDHHPEVRRKN